MHRVPAYRVTMRRRRTRRPPAAGGAAAPRTPGDAARSGSARWYVTEGRTLEQIARQHHTTRDTVRTWLQTAGVSVQPRTSREHRKHLDPVLLRDLYLDREWSRRRDRRRAGHDRPPGAADPARARHPGPQGRGTTQTRRRPRPSPTRRPVPGSGRHRAAAPAPHPGAPDGRHHHPTIPDTHSGHPLIPHRGLHRDRLSRRSYRATHRPTSRARSAAAPRSRDSGPAVRVAVAVASSATRN